MNKKVIIAGVLLAAIGYAVYSQSKDAASTANASFPYSQFEGLIVNDKDGASTLVKNGKLYPVNQAVLNLAIAQNIASIQIADSFWALYANNPLYMGTDVNYLG